MKRIKNLLSLLLIALVSMFQSCTMAENLLAGTLFVGIGTPYLIFDEFVQCKRHISSKYPHLTMPRFVLLKEVYVMEVGYRNIKILTELPNPKSLENRQGDLCGKNLSIRIIHPGTQLEVVQVSTDGDLFGTERGQKQIKVRLLLEKITGEIDASDLFLNLDENSSRAHLTIPNETYLREVENSQVTTRRSKQRRCRTYNGKPK